MSGSILSIDSKNVEILDRYRQRHPEKQSPDTNCAVVGICTGSVAAIASAVARSDLDLLRIAPEFVILSLRLGIEVSRRSECLESQSGSWSVVVPKIPHEGLSRDIAEFNDSRVSVSAW